MGAIADFVAAITPPDGIVYVVERIPQDGGKLWWKHYPVSSPQAAEARSLRIFNEGRDVYFAPATYKQGWVTGSDGKRKTSRELSNVHALRSYWLDIDVAHESKAADRAYPSLDAAIAAVKNWLATTKLPKPQYIVHSGNGVHVYWVTDEIVSLETWHQIATALRNCAQAAGILFDAGVTNTGTAILRVPDTANFKIPGNPRPVRMLGANPVVTSGAAFRAALAPWAGAPVKHVNGHAPSLNAALSSGLTGPKRPKKAAILLDGCGYMRWARETRGALAGYHAWRDMLSVVSLLDDGRELAHECSSAYVSPDPGKSYSVEGTDKAFDEARDKDRPAGCSQFAAYHTSCSVCPHNGKITSPIEISIDRSIPEAAKKNLPFGYAYNEQGSLCHVDTDDKGNPVLVTILPGRIEQLKVLDISLQGDVVKTERVIEFWWQPPGSAAWVRRQIPAEEFPVGDKLNQVLYWHRYDLPVNVNAVQYWKEFLVKSYREILDSKRGGAIDTVPDAYGWTVDNAFVVSRRVFFADGTEADTAAPDDLAGQYTERGQWETWRDAAQLITDKLSPELQLLVASSFAAPLVSLLGGSSSLLMNFTSRLTGTGKSSAMKVAITVWGHPDHAAMAVTDTDNAAMKKVASLRHLPLFWDELRKDNASTELVFRLTQGKGKARLSQHAQLREGGAWCTLLTCASNDSLMDKAIEKFKGEAGMARVFEVVVPPVPKSSTSQPEIDAAVTVCANNFGHAGRIYAKYIAQNRLLIQDKLSQLRAILGQYSQRPQVERFWLASATVLLAGAYFAGRAGILKFDDAAVFQAVNAVLKKLRMMQNLDEDEIRAGHVGPLDEEEYARREAARMIDDLVSDLRPHLLKTTSYESIPGRGPRLEVLIPPQLGKHCELHIACNPPVLRVKKSTLRKYCIEKSLQWSHVRDVWLTALGAVARFTVLGGRTNWSTGQREVLEIPLTHPTLAHLAQNTNEDPRRAPSAGSTDPAHSPGSLSTTPA